MPDGSNYKAFASGRTTISASALAKDYLDRGWQPVALRPRGKQPVNKGWQERQLTAEDLAGEFSDPDGNVGIRLGDASGGWRMWT